MSSGDITSFLVVPLVLFGTGIGSLATLTQALTHVLWAHGDGPSRLVMGGITPGTTHAHYFTQAGIYTVSRSVSDGVFTD